MMGVKEAIYGYLHEDMLAYEWEPIDRSALIHPKIEPEIAFFIDEDIEGEDITEKDISKFVVGSKLALPDTIDLGNIGMTMSKNGAVEQTGSSAAVLGHPLKAMVWAANLLGSRGKGFINGDIVFIDIKEELRVGVTIERM